MNDITSTSNQKIKALRELIDKPHKRDELQQFVVEGVREITHCLEGGFLPIEFFYVPEIIDRNPDNQEVTLLIARIVEVIPDGAFTISEKVYEKIAYRGSTEGVIAVFKQQPASLEAVEKELRKIIATGKKPLILVAEGLEKPGNIGALARTAASAEVDALLLCDCNTDIYNSNLIRASLGGIFLLKTAVGSSQEAIAMLKSLNINILTAQLQDSELYYEADMTLACAIVVGSEAKGLREAWRKIANKKILIPMLGKLDSLNVSVSAAILCYEALRQRTLSVKK